MNKAFPVLQIPLNQSLCPTIFAILFLKSKKSKKKTLFKLGKIFSISLQNLLSFSDVQIVEFYYLKFYDVMKCLSNKQEIHFAEYLGK